MGRLALDDMLDHTDVGTALHWHMRANLYPPPPTQMIDVARQAIELANAGRADELVELPEGVTYRDGRTSVPATAIIASFRLEGFIDDTVVDEYP